MNDYPAAHELEEIVNHYVDEKEKKLRNLQFIGSIYGQTHSWK